MKELEKIYSCPMHREVRQQYPGKCPKCGMDLGFVNEGGHPGELSAHMLHGMDEGHDHSGMVAGPEAAADFLHRFYTVTALLVPLAIFSSPAVKYLGVPDFAGRTYLEFGIASLIFYFGLVFFQHAGMEIRTRRFGMMTLVSLGVGAGYLFSALSTFISVIKTEFYLEISTLIWVLLFGHFLESKSSNAAGDALSEAAKLLPKEAHLKSGSKYTDVAVYSLKAADVVRVLAGEKVPADGKIIKGGGSFNESHITGESKPVQKKAGSAVIAGAISIEGSVEVKLTAVGDSSTVGHIRKLIATAEKTKPGVQKLADRAANWLTVSALGVSVITLWYWSLIAGQPFVFAVTMAITVLVIACPHALGLAIPTVLTIATRLAVNNGIFIKNMAKIEVIRKASCVVFDKTGTLTRGEFGVTTVRAISGNEKKLLETAGAIESQSSHVIGMSIVDYLKKNKSGFRRQLI